MLAKASQDDFIDVYTLQSADACKALRRQSILTCDPDFVFVDDILSFREAGKLFAYNWMSKQGSCRMGQNIWPSDTLPLWFTLTPNFDGLRKDDVCLKAKIPRRRLLPHFYDGWYQLLEIGYEVGAPGTWPNQWKSLTSPLIDPFINRSVVRDSWQPIPIPPPLDVCQRSWELMFDLSLLESPALQWNHTIHLAVPYLELTDVIGEDTSTVLRK